MSHVVKLAAVALALGFTSVGNDSVSDADLSLAIAEIIRQNGYPCSQVLDVRLHRDAERYEVTCREHSSNAGVARYIMNLREGTAVKA